MMTIGVDCHKATHTAVVLDEVGRRQATTTVAATPVGHAKLVCWAGKYEQRVWAVEDCRHVTSHLEADLLSGGERVLRVPPKLTGPSRRSQRTAGKSDPVDAEAVGRAALAHPGLPQATVPTKVTEAIRTVVSYREQAVSARTELICQLRWNLHGLDATYTQGNLTTTKHLQRARTFAGGHDGDPAWVIGAAIERIVMLTDQIRVADRRIADLVTQTHTGLVDHPGIGYQSAAEIISQVGDISRFATEAAFASYTGTAPIPASSGATTRWRLNRGGNRRLNATIHRIAISQLAHHQPAIDYRDKKMSQGKTRKEAIRALKRHITRHIYKTLTNELT